MFAIAVRTMRARWTGFAGAFVAMSLAVALVAGWGILLESGARATVAPQRLAGAPIVAAANQTLTVHHGHGDNAESESYLMPEQIRLPASTVGRIASLPGVGQAVDQLSFASAVRFHGHSVSGAQPTGHNWSSAALTPFTVRSGHAPVDDTQVVLDQGLAARGGIRIGDEIRVLAPTGADTLTVVGLVGSPRPLRLEQAFFVTDSVASRLAGHPGVVDSIGIFPRAGHSTAAVADAVHKAVGGQVSVLTGDDRGRAEFLDAVSGNNDLVSISGTIGGIAIMVAIFVVAGTLSISVQQRVREIALLRAVGATPGQVRRMIAVESAVLSLFASAAGIVPAIGLASWIGSAFRGRGLVSPMFSVHVGWIPFVVSAGAALLVAEAAAYLAGRRAAKVRPTDALRESATQPMRLGIVRILLGMGGLAGGGALLSVSLSAQGDDAAGAAAGIVMVLMVAVGFLGPIFVNLGARLFGAPARRISPVGGFLAAVSARSRSRRLASAVTPIALTVALSFITVFLQGTISRAGLEQSNQRLVADRIVQAPGPGVPEGVAADLSTVPGVQTAVGMLSTQVATRNSLMTYDAAAVTPGRLDRVLALDVTAGSLHELSGDQIALSANGGLAFHAGVGDRVTLRLGDGTLHTARVAAIYQRGLGLGDVLLPWSAVAGHVTTPAANSVLVRFAPGQAVSDHELLAGYPGAAVVDRTGYRAAQDRDQRENAWVNDVLLASIVGYAAVALVNTLAMTMAERRREFALLSLVGATPDQLLRTVRWEAGIVTALGISIGAGIGFATLLPFCRALGSGVSPYIAPIPATVLIGSTACLALAANLIPARLALRQRPIEAVGIRE